MQNRVFNLETAIQIGCAGWNTYSGLGLFCIQFLSAFLGLILRGKNKSNIQTNRCTIDICISNIQIKEKCMKKNLVTEATHIFVWPGT